jgi:hypothetical protein
VYNIVFNTYNHLSIKYTDILPEESIKIHKVFISEFISINACQYLSGSILIIGQNLTQKKPNNIIA